MKLDPITIVKLVVCLIAAAFVIALLALKLLPAAEATSAFTGLVMALLGALGLASAGRHIGAGLATRSTPGVFTELRSSDDIPTPKASPGPIPPK